MTDAENLPAQGAVCRDCAQGTAHYGRTFTCATCYGALPWDVPRVTRRKIERAMKRMKIRHLKGRFSRAEQRAMEKAA